MSKHGTKFGKVYVAVLLCSITPLVLFFLSSGKSEIREKNYPEEVYGLSCDNGRFKRTWEVGANSFQPEYLTYLKVGRNGRLGNQLFQIASTIGIAEQSNLSWAFPEDIAQTSAGKLFEMRGISTLQAFDCLEYRERDENTYNISLPLTPEKHILSLYGYFQSWQYFQHSYPTLRRHLKISPRLIEDVKHQVPEIKLPNAVTVHVRRGDYEKLSRQYYLLDEEYYTRALSRIHHIDVVIIVSDDVSWCEKHLSHILPYRVVIRPSGDELFDFVLLHLGKHVVIANSTYSWWAAFLKMIHAGESMESIGTIIAPDKMFRYDGSLSHLNRISFFHPEWTLINT